MHMRDESSIQRQRDNRAELMRRIAAVTRSYESGDMSFDKARDQIEELMNGEADRIVRVGQQIHKPEIQT